MEAEAAEEEEEVGYRIKKRTPHKDVGNDDHFGQKTITLTKNRNFVSNDDHFGHKPPSLWI